MQGSGATGDCCSKCFHQAQKAKGETAGTSEIKKPMDVVMEEPAPMQVDEAPVPEEQAAEPVAAPKKRKKKKASYKNMMAGMMSQGSEKDIEKEKERLRKVTGGGAFSKIDKI